MRCFGIPILNGREDLFVFVAGVLHHVGALAMHPDTKHPSQDVGLSGCPDECVVAGRFNDTQVEVVVRLVELVGDLLAFFRRIGLLLTLHQFPHQVVFFRNQLDVFRCRTFGSTCRCEGFNQVADLVKFLHFRFVDRANDCADLRNQLNHAFGRQLTCSFANWSGGHADFFPDRTIQQPGAGLEFARDQFLTQVMIGTASVRFDLVTPWSHCREVGVGRDEMDPGPMRWNTIGTLILPVTQHRSYASIDAEGQTHYGEVYALRASQDGFMDLPSSCFQPWVAA
ncbi:hypothetical protein RESH_00427 [Rhodopirellula europaea SH398]|uniref:Uncharacterized protein n=1 Tax=Rhodopirellula europaea SH398 TaxID=1263868 RepID=M5SMD4_9BACT|nr:hypothetical protein RESH_00427 [Rhodopirellula europaea SH398]